MTKEAMALYFETLVDDGVLLMHTSNRDYNLSPVVADVAQSLGFRCVNLVDAGALAAGKGPRGHFTSDWVLVARSPAALARVQAHVNPNPGPNGIPVQWRPMQGSGNSAWTDAALPSLWGLRR